MSNALVIDGVEIYPGQHQIVNLEVARLPTGTPINVNIHVFRSLKPGPVIMLNGGLHGDEINGIEIVRRTVQSDRLHQLKRGTVIAIPVLNVFGFINFSRAVPDGKDVNRSFPGSWTGSLAARVAFVLTKRILPLVDFGLDFHTGGASIHNSPQVRITTGDERAMEIATEFNAPFILTNKVIPKSLRKQALDMGKSIIVFEGGESLRVDEESIKVGMRGIENVLGHYKMLPAKSKKFKGKVFNSSKWIRAAQAGIFTLSKTAGMVVKKGELLGEINNLDERKAHKVKSPVDGHILAHVNNPVISRGDALFHLIY